MFQYLESFYVPFMGPYMHLAAVILQLSHVDHFVLIMIREAILMGRTYFIQDPPVFQRFMLITFYLLTLLFLKAATDRMYTGGSPILANRWLSTSILTSELGEGAFPSNLLSKKPVAMAERTIGLYQDLVIPVTNFLNEDKGFMV
ncbi:uncharacterized protein LOC122276643 isoform X2 [Carya illinoinensis]|uniref:uncharacterized protein LOC122276643 isoform X2 n=1 Tax=Carya illinoinensis TaxID=32201 RepID=UPI001C72808B|nr:uncharacterized protein LOC122276643 isoform X2 [Carya illinoinensis]